MPTFITQHDAELAQTLFNVGLKLYNNRQQLFAAHNGKCACDARELCGFHADVFQRLVALEKSAQQLHLLLQADNK